MNLSILTYHTKDYEIMGNLVYSNRQKYCDIWNYNHIIEIPKNIKYYYAIDRIKFLHDLLFEKNNNIDYVWVLNVHAMIMNYTIDVAKFLDDEHDFFITKDVGGLNAGSFIVKKSDWTKKWLNFIYEKAPYINHCWHEQKVMQDNENNPEFKDKIKVLKHPSINSYDYILYKLPETTLGHFNKGDFILHLPGTNLQERINYFTSEKIKNNIILQ